MRKLKICFIGCGSHAKSFVYPSLMSAEGFSLAAVCSLDAAEAESCAHRYGAEKSYTDYREMIDTEKPDAVIIVGPPKLHYEAGMYCISRKTPFYCEKPLGENFAQAAELCAAARKAGVFGQVGFMMRHSAVIRELRNRAADAKLNYGTVKYFTSGPYRSDDVYGLNGSDDLSFLWRYLMVQAVHPVNLAASFLGEISEITSEIRFAGENILLEIRLKDTENKRMNALLHTFVAPGYGKLRFETELFYDNRMSIFTDAFHSLECYTPEASPVNRSEYWQFGHFGSNNVKMGYETEIIYFLDCVRNSRQEPGLTTLDDAAKTMQILDTVKKQFTGEI